MKNYMASYPSGLRDRFAKPLFVGSNPTDASGKLCCPGGEIGRHKGLKIPRSLNSVPVRVRLRAHFRGIFQ